MAEKNFKQQLKSGFIYTAFAKYSGILISLAVTAVLSRMLPPEDFGVIAVASVFIVFFGIFSDMGLSAAIVQKRNLSVSDLKSLFSYTLFLGVILAVFFFFSSWLIARFYDDSQLIVICQILSVNVLFATWSIVPNGLLLRDKQFKFIGVRTVSIQIILAVISIFGAYTGMGIFSLLINPVGSSILIFILSYIKSPVGFTFHPSFESVRKIASYSSYTFGFSLINYFLRNLDKLLIGKVFGMIPLGYYEKSYRLMLLPVQNLTQVITPVLHPVLADYQSDISQQTNKYLKLLKILALIGFPISALLYFTAEPLVILIFGSQWMPSVPVFKILSLTVGFQITGSSVGAFLQASNKTREMFVIGCLNTLTNIICLLVGVYVIGSIDGVAWMFFLAMCIGLWNNWYIAKTIEIRAIEMFKPYVPALYPTVLNIMILALLHNFCQFSLIVSLIINVFVTSVLILVYLRHFHIIDVVAYLKTRLIRQRRS